jgi:hypothetical protein
MKKGLLVLAAAAMMLAPVSASAARVFIGGGGFYAPYWGPYWAPYGYAAPYYAEGYYPSSGEVKLDTKVKDAGVYINGAYAGTTHDNKTMHLRPGTYQLEIKQGGATRYSEKVIVAAGKTIHINPGL